jgi:hypothetical protein
LPAKQFSRDQPIKKSMPYQSNIVPFQRLDYEIVSRVGGTLVCLRG